ncbi:hypothetical protein AB6A40_005109 [Gnathostoma spinigerum]|uniref:Secreted protein n=1 Tax=Gnathostoma spinigerum TaxID=75299 RepID=A0ABD6EFM0_9BILA
MPSPIAWISSVVALLLQFFLADCASTACTNILQILQHRFTLGSSRNMECDTDSDLSGAKFCSPDSLKDDMSNASCELEGNLDSSNHEESKTSKKSENTEANENQHATDSAIKSTCSAVQRVRQHRQEFQISSPSDALMSPCTQKLVSHSYRPRARMSNPAAVLKQKQKTSIPKFDLENL